LNPTAKYCAPTFGWLNYFAGEPDKTATGIETVLREDRRFTSANIKLWAVYSKQHRYADAFRQLKVLSEENRSEQ
jgi:hypothetical protein